MVGQIGVFLVVEIESVELSFAADEDDAADGRAIFGMIGIYHIDTILKIIDNRIVIDLG